MSFHQTENLSLDNDGILYHRVDVDGDIDLERLGHIDDVEYEASELGFADEYAEHLDQWQDSQRCDYAGQVRHDYAVLQGF